MWLYSEARNMAPTAPMFQSLCLIMLQMILNVVRGGSSLQYNHTTSWRSARPKRFLADVMPDRLKITVRYETGEEVNLNWIKGKQVLANQNLPIKTPTGYPNPNVMKDVGEFVVYHDLEKSSAVVYFAKFQRIFGVIGMNYYITDLPYEFNSVGEYQEVVGPPYVMKREYTPTHNHPLFSESMFGNFRNSHHHESDGTTNSLPDSEPGPNMQHQRVKRDSEEVDYRVTKANVSYHSHIRTRRGKPLYEEFYIEILVFVPRDVADTFKEFWGADNYIEWIVRYYILYFHAVDMIFQQLQSHGRSLQINIAGIVVQGDEEIVDFIGHGDPQFSDIVLKLQQYLYLYKYPPNSYDHVFISTRRPILHNSARVLAATKPSGDFYEAWKQGDFYNAVPITVVDFEEQYILTVHEIGLTLNIKVDNWEEGLKYTGQCTSIMQEGSSKCDNCLVWRNQHQKQLTEFLKHNRNRCFLRNKPRSLLPVGPSPSLTPHQQCQCFGYDSHSLKNHEYSRSYVLIHGCLKPLQCDRSVGDQVHSEFTVLPLDGTKCTNYKKVCWGGQCVPIEWKHHSM